MATYRKRGNKWQVQIRRTGHQLLTKTFTLKADAEAWVREKDAELDRRSLSVDIKALERITLANLMRRYRDTVTPGKRGCDVETIRLNALLRHRVVALRLSDLSATRFNQYRDERLRVVGAGTVLRELNLIQSIIETARKEWGIPLVANPLASVRKPQAPKARDRRLEEGELQALLAGCAKCRNKTLAPMITLAVETGMRRGELLNIRWSDVNLGERTLHIPKTKNGHPRTIPLTPLAVETLRKLKAKENPSPLPMSVDSFKMAWRRLVARTKIADLRFHDLRHEAVSRFFEMGLSIPEVALISGHRDPRMLFRYTHLRADELAAKLGGDAARTA